MPTIKKLLFERLNSYAVVNVAVCTAAFIITAALIVVVPFFVPVIKVFFFTLLFKKIYYSGCKKTD